MKVDVKGNKGKVNAAMALAMAMFTPSGRAGRSFTVDNEYQPSKFRRKQIRKNKLARESRRTNRSKNW